MTGRNCTDFRLSCGRSQGELSSASVMACFFRFRSATARFSCTGDRGAACWSPTMVCHFNGQFGRVAIPPRHDPPPHIDIWVPNCTPLTSPSHTDIRLLRVMVGLAVRVRVLSPLPPPSVPLPLLYALFKCKRPIPLRFGIYIWPSPETKDSLSPPPPSSPSSVQSYRYRCPASSSPSACIEAF